MASKPTSAKPPEQTFETAIERLEAIVEEMESDKMPLEQLLARYEEGTGLVKVCQERLEAAEQRIEMITRGAGGKPQLAPFSTGPTVVASAAPRTAADESDEDVSLF